MNTHTEEQINKSEKPILLYSREQVMKAIAIGFDWCHQKHVPSNDMIHSFMESLNPIKLPSDEEIEKVGKLFFESEGHNIYTHYNTVPSWVEGAKWMREEIMNK